MVLDNSHIAKNINASHVEFGIDNDLQLFAV